MNFPRRNCVDKMTPAELAIRAAVIAVESAGADTRLTDAVVLLGKAQNRVADFVDGVAETPQAAGDTTSRTEQLEQQREDILEALPDSATCKHPETGESLTDNIRDLVRDKDRLQSRNSHYFKALSYLVDQIRRCKPIDDHGHEFVRNKAFVDAAKMVEFYSTPDAAPTPGEPQAGGQRLRCACGTGADTGGVGAN